MLTKGVKWREECAAGAAAEGIVLPVGSEGRLVPTSLLKVASAETVEAPARMPALGGATTPSRGGKEGIVRTGVSRSSEANQKNASL